MRFFRITAATAAALAFVLACLGSWTRINGAGMTCPDWPLCRGAVVPPLGGGVDLEFSHRVLALAVGLVIAAWFIGGRRLRSQLAGGTPAMYSLIVVFVLQVVAGAITIHEANSPRSVVLHWGLAMLLLATLVVLTVIAFVAPRPGSGVPALRRGAPLPALGSR